MYNVVLNAGNGGSATGSGSFAYGSTVMVKALPSQHYQFSSWMEGSKMVSESAIYTFVVKGDIELKANFKLVNYKVEIVSNNGTVSGGRVSVWNKCNFKSNSSR